MIKSLVHFSPTCAWLASLKVRENIPCLSRRGKMISSSLRSNFPLVFLRRLRHWHRSVFLYKKSPTSLGHTVGFHLYSFTWKITYILTYQYHCKTCISMTNILTHSLNSDWWCYRYATPYRSVSEPEYFHLSVISMKNWLHCFPFPIVYSASFCLSRMQSNLHWGNVGYPFLLSSNWSQVIQRFKVEKISK